MTKTWPEESFPLQPVGRLVLNANPDNFFAENEQLAFCPALVVPGIAYSDDKLLQTRVFSYADTQRHRCGGGAGGVRGRRGCCRVRVTRRRRAAPQCMRAARCAAAARDVAARRRHGVPRQHAQRAAHAACLAAASVCCCCTLQHVRRAVHAAAVALVAVPAAELYTSSLHSGPRRLCIGPLAP